MNENMILRRSTDVIVAEKIKNVYYKTTFTECINIFKFNNIRPTSNSTSSFISTSLYDNCTYCEVLIKLNYNKLNNCHVIKEHDYINKTVTYNDFRIITDETGLVDAVSYIEDIIVNFKHNCRDHNSYQESCTKCKFNEYRINQFESEILKYSNFKIKFNFA